MTEIIMNEAAWCEEHITNHTTGKSTASTLASLARYYHTNGHSVQQIKKLLEEFLIRCDQNVNIFRWSNCIDYCASHADSRPLIDISYIPITTGEIDAIKSINGILAQKLMFTLLCLAKYGDVIFPKNNHWVNYERHDIFSLANISFSVNRQVCLINDLWQAGLIGYSNIVDNTNMQVKLFVDGDVAMKVTDFRNLGNQYCHQIMPGFMACENCGLIIRRASHASKYCKKCGVSINIAKTNAKRTTVLSA